MITKGLSTEVSKVFEEVSLLECLKGFYLIGGTALSLQIGHRLSEDLDFCKWPLPGKTEVDWPSILIDLRSVFKSVDADILDFNQVNFNADNIKISFYSNHLYKSPVKNIIPLLNNIVITPVETIGIMKLEVMLRRSNFRDYYDIFSILKTGVSLKSLVDGAIKYSNHILKTRDILNFISSGDNFKRDRSFHLLNPVYDQTENDIEKYIRGVIREEFS